VSGWLDLFTAVLARRGASGLVLVGFLKNADHSRLIILCQRGLQF
jgi:hypothetical protein